MATGGGWDAGVSPEDFSKDAHCRHGRPECECLDTQLDMDAISSQVALNGVAPLTGVTFTVGTSTTPPPSVPLGVQQWSNLQAVSPPLPTGCAVTGHRMVHDPIMDDEGTVTGVCENCYQVIRFDKYEPAFDFEQAGILLGRAIGIDCEDPDSVGEILAELAALRCDIGRHMKRFEAAIDLLSLATGIVQKRALHDTATAVDAT